MKTIFSPGDKKTYNKTVAKEDAAVFPSGEVHPFYGTFALGRDVEWASRLFVLEMKEDQEEGIGTYLHINHHSPALIGEDVLITAEIESIHGAKVNSTFKVEVGTRLIASGKTGQMILNKSKIDRMISELNG
jgi:fluoroacetyl-CoA thioesterase